MGRDIMRGKVGGKWKGVQMGANVAVDVDMNIIVNIWGSKCGRGLFFVGLVSVVMGILA